MKKVLLLALVLVFALSTFVCAAPATAFVDVPANDPSYGYVQQLIKDGVITDTDGAFNGNKTLTRYEMAAFVAKAIKSVNNTSAANKVLIQKLAVEFEAQLEEMNVRLTAMETKAAAVQGWFSPTMPKFSGEFSIAYNNGLKNYYAPYVSGTGTWVDNQANVFELDLNFNGSLSTAYNMSYHGGFAVTANYLQKFNNVLNSVTNINQTFNGTNTNIYIDGDFPGLATVTKAAYSANTTFALGVIDYNPGAAFAVSSSMAGLRLSNVFDNGLNISLFGGVNSDELAYAGIWTPGSMAGAPGHYSFGALINPGKNKGITGENFFDMYGQIYDPLDTGGSAYVGSTKWGATALGIGAAYPIGAWTIKAGYAAVLQGAGPTKPYVGQVITDSNPNAPTVSDIVDYVTPITAFQNLDAGAFYDDGYWHGSLRLAYSPTYDDYSSSYCIGIIAPNVGASVNWHAGITDKTKQWSYDAFLSYSNVGPLAGYAVDATTVGMGGQAAQIGFNFTPIVGSLWENSYTFAQAAYNSQLASGWVTNTTPEQTQVFATKLHFYF